MSEIKTAVDMVKGATNPTLVVTAQSENVGVVTIVPCHNLAEYDEMLEKLQSLRTDVERKFAGKPIKDYTGKAVFKNGLFYSDSNGNIVLVDSNIIQVQGVAPQFLTEIGDWHNVNVYRGEADIDKKKTLGDIEELQDLKRKLERKPTLGEAMGNILKNR
jgi:hypothetical protein